MKKYQTPTVEWNFCNDADVIRTSRVFAGGEYNDPENAAGINFDNLF